MLIQINTNRVATALDFIVVRNFYLQMEAWEKKLLFIELIWAHLGILITKIKISYFLVKQNILLILCNQKEKEFVLNLYYNGSNCVLFVNAIRHWKYYALFLGNISKDFPINNLKNRIKRSVNFFYVPFNLIF